MNEPSSACGGNNTINGRTEEAVPNPFVAMNLMGRKIAARSRKVQKDAAKRLLIIDAMNIMHMGIHDIDRAEKRLDCLTVLPIVRYFVRRGHAVEVVVPEFCIYKKNFQNHHIWKELSSLKMLIVVPYMVHDDLVALTVARDACGSVITRDRFRDHLASFPHLHNVRSRNVLLECADSEGPSTFYTDSKGDKYYRSKFTCVAYSPEQFYSFPGNDDYELVKGEKWPTERRKAVLKHIDSMYALAEARHLVAEGQQLPESNQCGNLFKIPFTVEAYERILKDREGNDETVEREENLNALKCWRSIARKQEIKYQMREGSGVSSQRCAPFGCAEGALHCFSGTSHALQKFDADERSENPISGPIESDGFVDSLNKTRAEAKASLWKTLNDEMELYEKSLYDFLMSWNGRLEKELVLNAYFDHLSGLTKSADETVNPESSLTKVQKEEEKVSAPSSPIQRDSSDCDDEMYNGFSVPFDRNPFLERRKKSKSRYAEKSARCSGFDAAYRRIDKPEKTEESMRNPQLTKWDNDEDNKFVSAAVSHPSTVGDEHCEILKEPLFPADVDPKVLEKEHLYQELLAEFQINSEILFQTILITETTDKQLIMAEYHKRVEQLKCLEKCTKGKRLGKSQVSRNDQDAQQSAFVKCTEQSMPDKGLTFTADSEHVVPEESSSGCRPSTSAFHSVTEEKQTSMKCGDAARNSNSSLFKTKEVRREFRPTEGALMCLEEAERLRKQNWATLKGNRKGTNLGSNNLLHKAQNKLQRIAGQRKPEQSMFLNDFLGAEKERLWKWLVRELDLDRKVLFNVLSSWDKGCLRAEQVVDAYYECLGGRTVNNSGSDELSVKECLMRDLLSDTTSSLDKNILSQVIAVSTSCDREEILSQYEQRIKEIRNLSDQLESERVHRREAERKKKEELLQELLAEMPSLDENVLSQVIAASISYDKQNVISEYWRCVAQTEEFNRRLMQGEHLHTSSVLTSHLANKRNDDEKITQLKKMGIHEELIRKVLASSKENLDVNALADKCFSLS